MLGCFLRRCLRCLFCFCLQTSSKMITKRCFVCFLFSMFFLLCLHLKQSNKKKGFGVECDFVLPKNRSYPWTPTTHGKMKVLSHQNMGYNFITPKNEGYGFPWYSITISLAPMFAFFLTFIGSSLEDSLTHRNQQ